MVLGKFVTTDEDGLLVRSDQLMGDWGRGIQEQLHASSVSAHVQSHAYGYDTS